jgi:hypothetical protein
MDVRRFNFESSAIAITIKLAKFLHTIPQPGDLHFPFLRDSLYQFGLSWKSISFEDRSARLRDKLLKFSLFDETVGVKVFVDQVEVQSARTSEARYRRLALYWS